MRTWILAVAVSSVFACSRREKAPVVLESGPAPDTHATDAALDVGSDVREASAYEPGDAGTHRGERAERCLADPLCSRTQADRWFVDADDAHDTVDCFRFLDGVATKRDVSRGRACLERGLGGSACEAGSSADLDAAELAMLLIDGIGGPRDVRRARSLFAPCFDDVTTSWVRQRADDVERDPKAPPHDPCEPDGHVTTLVQSSCMARAKRNAEARADLAAKTVAAGLDDTGRRLLVASTTAYRAYAQARARYAYEVYVEGSVRNAVALALETQLHESRAKELAELLHFGAPDASAEDVAREERRERTALAGVVRGTPAEGRALQQTEETWRRFRDAELDLYAHLFGAKQGDAEVRRALRVRLASRRSEECGPPPP